MGNGPAYPPPLSLVIDAKKDPAGIKLPDRVTPLRRNRCGYGIEEKHLRYGKISHFNHFPFWGRTDYFFLLATSSISKTAAGMLY
jgi:hypothetical protein